MSHRNIVFVFPYASEANLRFARALARQDRVRLLGVCRTLPRTEADRALFHDLVQVADGHELPELIAAIDLLRQRHGAIQNVTGVVEAIMVQLAEVREHFGIEQGARVRVAELFRDKAKMKDHLRAAGVPVARHRAVTSVKDAHDFASEVGLPLVLKPLAGVGSVSTCGVRTAPELLQALEAMRVSPSCPVLAEEMITGPEHTYETITIGGEPVAHSFSRYLPNCLDVLENPWIQWICMLPREIDTELYAEARRIGRAVIRALGLQQGMTHMEFFERPGGGLVVGEIGMRPPGPQLCQMTGLVHDVDIYEAWARAELDGVFDQTWERRYAAGTAFVRGVGQGRVAGVTGIRETQVATREGFVEARLPVIGMPKNPSYEGDGYVVVRHESTDEVRRMLAAIVKNVRVHYA